jgi:GDP dissociation inhibitor
MPGFACCHFRAIQYYLGCCYVSRHVAAVLGAGKTHRTSRVVRALCILSHPIPQTHDASSCQIILPQKQVCMGYLSAMEVVRGGSLLDSGPVYFEDCTNRGSACPQGTNRQEHNFYVCVTRLGTCFSIKSLFCLCYAAACLCY